MLPPHCYSMKKINGVRGIVVHWISLEDLKRYWDYRGDIYSPKSIIQFLEDYNTNKQFRKYNIYDGPRNYASYHALIDRKGNITDLVPHTRQAWHAGKSRSYDLKIENLNEWTLGAALIGSKGIPYTEKQIDALAVWCADQCHKHDINPRNIWGHDKVRAAYKSYHPLDNVKDKEDPGTYLLINGGQQYNPWKLRLKIVERLNA